MLQAIETPLTKTRPGGSFSRPVLLIKTVVWRSDPTLVLLHREVVLTREKDRDLERRDVSRIQQQSASVLA